MARLTVTWTGVFTLLTISIGEELQSRFFKVLSCVRSSSLCPSLRRVLFLTQVCPVLGVGRDLCYHVARDRRSHHSTFYHGQDVLCTMSRNGSVSEAAEGREDGFERSEGGSMIAVQDGVSDLLLLLTWLDYLFCMPPSTAFSLIRLSWPPCTCFD